MDADVQQILILVYQPDGLLLLAIVDDLLQSVKPSHSMVDMSDEIAGAQVVEVFQG